MIIYQTGNVVSGSSFHFYNQCCSLNRSCSDLRHKSEVSWTSGHIYKSPDYSTLIRPAPQYIRTYLSLALMHLNHTDGICNFNYWPEGLTQIRQGITFPFC